MNTEVSIIVPVYNKETYVERCIHQLIQQDFNDFEVVIVDDGSTDQSGLLCDKFATTDKRLKVYHTSNSGVTAARRYGLEHSHGRFIMFVDSDDELLPGALRKMYQAISLSGADEVIATYRTQYGHHHDSGRRGLQAIEPLVNDLLATRNTFCVLWGIIFRRELLEGCLNTPREIVEREDTLMQIKCLIKQPKVFFIEDCIYLYNEGLPNERKMGLDRIRIFDYELKQSLQPQWEKYETGYYLYQLKTYEGFLNKRQFNVFSYYLPLRKKIDHNIPLADRIVINLPPRLAYWPVHIYKWWLRRVSR